MAATPLQRMVRWFWRKEIRGPATGDGLTPAQAKIVRVAEKLPRLESLTPGLARLAYRLIDHAYNTDREPLARVDTMVIDSGREAGIRFRRRVRAYYPDHAPETTRRGALVYFHGGGCVIGDLETHDRFCRYVAKRSKLVVLSIDYRRGPEFPFPTPVEDAVDAWNWIIAHADDLQIDVDRTGVGGDSAGGYLATFVCIQAIQSNALMKADRRPAYQWLIYPMLDLRLDTESGRRCTSGMLLTRALVLYLYKHYLGSRYTRSDVVVSPGRYEKLESLPPTFLCTVGFDPLEDEGHAYVQRLRTSGVDVTSRHYPDMLHGFIGMGGVCPRARANVDEMIVELGTLVASAGESADGPGQR